MLSEVQFSPGAFFCLCQAPIPPRIIAIGIHADCEEDHEIYKEAGKPAQSFKLETEVEWVYQAEA